MSRHWITRRNFLSSAAAAALPMPAQQAARIESQFRDVPNGYRLRMHWYVFGPAWTPEEGERELKLMADAHVGGVLLFPAYPIAVDNPSRGIENQRYLSPAYLETLRAITGACKRASLTFDMVLGTGWPYGGPLVSLEQSAHALRMLRVAPGALREGERWISAPGATGPVFYSAPTRMEVKRAALGAEGLVVDHYNPDA